MANAETTKERLGCFARGCLITSVIGFTFLILLIGGTWFLYKRAVDTFTSPQPVQITTEIPTDAQYKSANEMLDRLHTALANDKRDTIEFTATDLNALIARHPDFANPRRQIRIGMANSIMTVEMSIPFDPPRLPLLKGRWFNCTARFSLDYVYGQFSMIPKSLVANGHAAPDFILSENFVSSFNRSFTRSFMNSLSRSREGEAFWKRIRRIAVQDDKLVVMTEPAGGQVVRWPNELWPSRRNASRDPANVRPYTWLDRRS